MFARRRQGAFYVLAAPNSAVPGTESAIGVLFAAKLTAGATRS